MIAEINRTNHHHVEISNVNQANSNAKMVIASTQSKFVMAKINVVIIQKKATNVIDSLALKNSSNAMHIQTKRHFV